MGSGCSCGQSAAAVYPGDGMSVGSRRSSGVAERFMLTVHRARGLPAADRPYRSDPSSDPYVRVLDEAGSEIGRTPVVFKSLDPDFDYSIPIFVHPSTPASFRVEIWDWNVVLADTLLGTAKVDVATMAESDGEVTIPLRNEMKGNDARPELVLSAVRSQLAGSDVGLGGFGVLVGRGMNVPRVDLIDGESDTFVKVEVVGDPAACGKTGVRWRCAHPMWNEPVFLGDPQVWSLADTELRFTLYDCDHISVMDKYIGEARILVRDLVRRPSVTLLMCNREGNPVLSTQPPHLPCEIDVAVLQTTMPDEWPKPRERNYTREEYPRHIFVMTRGTRGDVQPFVALARGLATHLGWMVTICTELKWKSFVEKNAAVPKGRIRFLPSGGDTDRRVNKASARWAMASKGEAMQSLMLAFAEAEFFDSGPVFVHHLLRTQSTPTPADLIVFSFTTAGVAMLASERCGVPCAGFILQPSCIPSSDPDWKAVVAIDSHSFQTVDRIEETYFTSHDTLATLKSLAESGWMGKHSLRDMRKKFGLRPAPTWGTLKALNVPLVIPMAAATFKRPADWADATEFTDFIFLRGGGGSASALSGPAADFVERAKRDDRKLVVMTFSSMPVKRAKVLKLACRMVTDSIFPVSVLYVGARQQDSVPAATQRTADQLVEEGKLLELTAVDFGLLFPLADAFVVHGGLGTTVEALRTGRPVAVTGPLLMDQRFWGGVCHSKGVGPAPLHIDDFHNACVEFCDGALDPADPEGWQKRAREHMRLWGEVGQDGVKRNVDAFAALLERGLPPVRPEEAPPRRSILRRLSKA